MKYPQILYVQQEGSGQDKFLATYKTPEEAVIGNQVGNPTKIAVYKLVEVRTFTLTLK